MAVGSAFYQWASVGMFASMLAVPDYIHRPVETIQEDVVLPWTHASTGHYSDSAALYSANETALQALLFGQAADRFRRNGGPVGAIPFASFDLDSNFRDIGRVSCTISADNRTVCLVTTVRNLPFGIVSAAINDIFGRDISGVFDGTNIVPPAGASFPPPAGVSIPNGRLVMLLG